MNDLFKSPQYKANLNYNGFDMGQRIEFSSTVGHLLPIYWDILSPGDKISVKDIMKTRTMPLDSSAFASLKDNIDYFFVPFEQIYKPFGSLFFNVKDWNSSLFNGTNLATILPHTDLYSLFVNILDGSSTSEVYDCVVLLDSFGYPASYILKNFCTVGGTTSEPTIVVDEQGLHNDPTANISVNLFKLACYQKIYSDFYRLDDRDDYDPYIYNLDYAYQHSGTLDPNVSMLILRKRAWKRDFFTSLFVDPLIAAGTMAEGSNVKSIFSPDTMGALNNWTGDVSQIDTLAASSTYLGGLVGTESLSLTSLTQALNTSNIRAMFAVEKLEEIQRRSQKTVDMQTLAHFGVKVNRGVSNQVYYLGSHDSQINIGDVISTAATDSQALGSIAGRAYGYNQSGDIKFEAPVHGMLVAIYSCVPEVTYSNLGIDRLDTYLHNYDFFVPEYDNLGMQPLFKYQCTPELSDDVDAAKIVGWQYRYSELKTKFPRAFAALASNLSYWTVLRDLKDISAGTTRDELEDYLVQPDVIDTIMSVNYRTGASPSDIYTGDPLLHEFYIDCRKASKMSEYSLPQLTK